MTSLAKQLERLAIPGQPSLRQLVSKKRASLLFDRREAADIDQDTFFSLGLNGLEELIRIDPTFSQFEDSLFQDSCKEFERSVQTPDVLDELDKNLSLFLRRLSPYFLLKAGQKCLEWLIHAFRVHLCNVDAVMECVLPYYNTKLFARVVQLLPLKAPSSRWHWLRPLQKAGTPLSRVALIQHCLSDLSFFVFICEIVPRAVSCNTPMTSGSVLRPTISLYCSTVVLVLEKEGVVSEEIIGRLMPYVLKGLKSRVTEYRAASYIVVGQLVSKTTLNERVTSSLLESVTKKMNTELVGEALSCVAIVCHTQNITKLSKKMVKYLLRVSKLPSLLSSLSSTHNISPLLRPLLCTLVSAHFCNHGDSVAVETVKVVLDEVVLEDEVVLALIRELMEQFIQLCQRTTGERDTSRGNKKNKKKKKEEEEEEEKEEKNEEEEGKEENEEESVLAPVATLVQSLDTKYPQLFDQTLQTALVTDRDGTDSEERVKLIHRFVAATLPGSRHQVVRKKKMKRKRRRGEEEREEEPETLVLSVHHPESSVREAAVRQLGELLLHDSTRFGVRNDQFVRSCLLSRLSDDEPTIVHAVLELGGKVLTDYLPVNEIVSSLSSLLSRSDLPLTSLSSWHNVATSTLSLLFSPPLSHMISPKQLDDVVITSLPLLFVHRRGNRLAGEVAEILSEVQHPLLQNLNPLTQDGEWRSGCCSEAEKDGARLAAANSSLLTHIGSQLSRLDPPIRRNLVLKLISKATSTPPDDPTHFLFIGVLGVAMKTSSTHSGSSSWLHPALLLLEYINESISELLAEGSPLSLSSPEPSLCECLKPLARKNVRLQQAHCHLVIWLLNIIIHHLPCVNVSTDMWLGVPDCRVSSKIGKKSEEKQEEKEEEEEEEKEENGREEMYHSALLSLFSLITSHQFTNWATEPSKHLLSGLLKVHLSNRGHLLRFLAMLWTAPPTSRVTVAMQASSLAVFSSYLKCLSPDSLLALTSQLCPVVPALLIPLTSQQQPIRQEAFACLSLLQSGTARLSPPLSRPSYLTTPLLFLLDTLVEEELALTSDPTSLPGILGRLYQKESGESSSRGGGGGKTRGERRRLGMREKSGVLDGLLNGILARAVTLSPPSYIQCSLLHILSEVDTELKVAGTQTLLEALLNKASSSFSSSSSAATSPSERRDGDESWSCYDVETLKLCLAALTPSVAAGFTESFLSSSSDTLHSFQLLLRALNLTTPLPLPSSSSPSPFEIAILQVTPAFFSALSADSLRLKLLNCLVSLLASTKRSEVAVKVKECIKKLELSGELVVEVLSCLSGSLGDTVATPMATPTRKKLRQAKEVQKSVELESPLGSWREITVLLELLQDSCIASVTDSHLLTPHLFNLLNRCIQGEKNERLQLEYIQQLILGALHAICTKLTSLSGTEQAKSLLPESVFNVELVVQCVRLSSNPLTHHHALLLLSSATPLYPSQVLHNIMPVFTFMGSSLLRNDDHYSFQVITQTLDSVLPPLLQCGASVLPVLPSTHPSGTPSTPHLRRPHPKTTPTSSTEEVVTEIFRVFVDAIPHVPDHRRLPLLSHLLTRVGPAQFLSTALGLLVTKHVEQQGVKDQAPKEALLSVSFPVLVAQLFCVELQLIAGAQLLSYTITLPLEKPHSVSRVKKLGSQVNRIFNVATHSQKQLLQFKCSSLSLLSSILSHRRLAQQMTCVPKESLESIENTFQRILKETLDYGTILSKHKSSSSQSSSTHKLRLSLVGKVADVISHVTSHLTPTSLVAVVMHLLNVSGEEVKVKALKIVSKKVEDGSYFTSDDDGCLGELLDAVVGVAKSDSSHMLTRHSAVYCIKLLARKLGQKYHSQLTEVLSHVPTGPTKPKHTHLSTMTLKEVLSLLLNSDTLSAELVGSCLLTIAEIASSLGPHFIPLLPPSLPPVIDRLDEEGVGVMVQTAAVTTLGVIVQTLPKFLSSFAIAIVTKLCMLEKDNGGERGEEKEQAHLSTEASLTRERVSKLVPVRTLVPVYIKVYPLCSQGKGSLLRMLEMLKLTVTSMSQEEARNLSPQLGDLFLLCLDHRAQHSEDSMKDLDTIEEHCVQAFTQLVVHLSESVFRPMFLKFLDWATKPGSDENRLISFYHLADSVAGKLKGLFLLFAGHIVKNMSTLLEMTKFEHKGEKKVFEGEPEKTNSLLSHLLNCLHKILLHTQPSPSSSSSSSSSSFLTRERFDALMPPLVNQVSNLIGGGEVFQRRVETHLLPCLAQLAVAAGREDLWKPLNHQLLLKTRHKKTEVRYASVVVLKEVYSRLGTEFMTLLPETIPFLAELLEDESEEVERETQSLISAIESQIGESIHQYFQ